MMNKLKSAKVHLVKFLFILPVLGIILVSFRNQVLQMDTGHAGPGIPVVLNDTLPATKKLKGKVKGINIDDDKARVTLKDGAIEEYDLGVASQKKAFIEKYGEIPPPPPPPPAPAPPAFAPAPPPPPPPPPPPAPANLPDHVKRIQVNNDKVRVWLKDGTNELYDLSDPAQKLRFEKNYGTIPPPVPPVPPIPATSPVEPFSKRNNGILNDVAREFEITDEKAVLTLKNGTQEVYDLKKRTERQAFESKYGKIYTAGSNSNGNTVPVAYLEGSGKTVIAPMAPRPGEIPQVIDDFGYTITGKEDFIITITKNTTRNELENFRRQMKEKGIDLYYENISYNNGILTALTGYMRSKDGRSNFVATDFRKLVLAMIKKDERTYFKVSVQEDKDSV